MAERKKGTTTRKPASKRSPRKPRAAGKAGPKAAKAAGTRKARAAGAKQASVPRPKPGRRLSIAQAGVRDSLMMARRAQGWTWAEVAAEAGLNEKTAREAVASRREALPLELSMDPAAIVQTSFEGYQASLADLERLAVLAVEKEQLAVAVGAKKGANEAREKILALLQATGRMPQELGALRHLLDLRAIGARMLDTMDRFERAVKAIEMPEDSRAEIEDAVGEVRGTWHDLIGIEEERPELPA